MLKVPSKYADLLALVLKECYNISCAKAEIYDLGGL